MHSICYVHKDISSIDRGGLCVLFKTLAKGMSRKGWKVSVITSQPFEMEGIETYLLQKTSDPYQYSREVSEALLRIKPDIAECSTWRFELLEYVNHTNRTAKVIVRCDPTTSTLFPNLTSFDSPEQELCKKADMCIAISKFAQQDIKNKYLIKDVRLVFNGIDEIPISSLVDDFLSSGERIDFNRGINIPLKNTPIKYLINEDKTSVFWIGKPTFMKGFDILEHIVEESGSSFQFIINNGYSQEEVKWKKENYNKCTFIRGLAKTDQLTLFSRCNTFLSTSRREGFGIAVSEGLSLGLPVILNNECRVYKEFLPNNAVSLMEMVNPQDVLDKIKEISQQKVNHSRNPNEFTTETMTNKSIQEYLSIL